MTNQIAPVARPKVLVVDDIAANRELLAEAATTIRGELERLRR